MPFISSLLIFSHEQPSLSLSSSLTPHQAIRVVGTMIRIDQIRNVVIMAAPFEKKMAQNKTTAHSERLLILGLEEIHPICAVTRSMPGRQ
jgi:hypothetical protein